MSKYLLNQNSAAENIRLAKKVDPIVFVDRYLAPYIDDQSSFVLDIGCGPGVIGAEVAKRVNEVIGVDINEARYNANIFKDDYHFVCSNSKELPFKDNTFDLVYSRFLFQHIPALAKQTLKEMHRVCKQGGVILVQEIDQNMIKHHNMEKKLENLILSTVDQLIKLELFEPNMGSKLAPMFSELGLENPNIRQEIYHNFFGQVSSEIIARELKKVENSFVNIAKIVGEEKANYWKKGYIEHLKNPNSSTWSHLYTVSGRKQ